MSFIFHPLPVQISPADRVLIDRHIAEKEAAGGTVFVPRGVSGMDDEGVILASCWSTRRRGQPKALREKLSRKRGDYRRLVDEGKSGPEIAKIIGVKLPAVYQAIRRMGLKLRRSPL